MDQVAGADAHNGRSNSPSHANHSMTLQNVVLVGGGVPAPQLLVARLRKAGIRVPLKKTGLNPKTKRSRRQRIIAFNVLCGAGEEFFRKVDPVKWARRSVEFLKKTFGEDNVLTAQLHLDERVPHLHAIIAPIAPEGRLSAAQVLGQDKATQPEDLDGVRRGNGSVPFLRRLQREYHSLCLEFDPTLSEPVPGGVMTHQSVSKWREWIARAHQELPALAKFIVEPPTQADRLAPETYAQRQVDSCQHLAQQTIIAMQAKVVAYDEQLAANQHMQKSLRRLDKENTDLKQQLLEIQQRFRKVQMQLEDLSPHDLCEYLGLPIEQVDGKPQIVLPSGQLMELPLKATHQPYTDQLWSEIPTLVEFPIAFGLSESDLLSGLASLLPLEEVERLVAYRHRCDLQIDLAQLPGKELTKLVRLVSFDTETHKRLAQALKANFGISESWLNPGDEFVKNFDIAITNKRNLALVHRGQKGIDGIAVNGSKPSASGAPFEQYLGSFQKDPIVIGSASALHTVIVSNVIEAFSMLSVPELARSIRTVVSGTTHLEKVAARAFDRPRPVVLVEYGSGRRCGRHRRLRELLQQGTGKEVQKLSPSDLRLGKPTFETIAIEVQQNPLLGAKLARLIGVPAGSGKSPKCPTPKPDQPLLSSTPQPPSADGSISL